MYARLWVSVSESQLPVLHAFLTCLVVVREFLDILSSLRTEFLSCQSLGQLWGNVHGKRAGQRLPAGESYTTS